MGRPVFHRPLTRRLGNEKGTWSMLAIALTLVVLAKWLFS